MAAKKAGMEAMVSVGRERGKINARRIANLIG